MSHRNARLTFQGRRLLVARVRVQGMPVAHVAKAMGISRQCAHRWVVRFDCEGDAGLWDRSSRPVRMPTKTSPEVEARVLAARAAHRRGQDWLGPELGVPARTVSRILRRHQVPRLCECDPLTGEVIRAPDRGCGREPASPQTRRTRICTGPTGRSVSGRRKNTPSKRSTESAAAVVTGGDSAVSLSRS